MTRRTFGIGMSGVALSLLGTAPTEESTVADKKPDPAPEPVPAPQPAKPYEDPH